MLPLLTFSLSASSGSMGDLTGTLSLSSRAATAIRAVSTQSTGAVVRVRVSDACGEVNGTGFFVDPTGTICTVADLVKGSDSIVVMKDGKEYSCNILALDERSGAAFLKLIAELPHSGENFVSPRALLTPSPFTPVIAIGCRK